MSCRFCVSYGSNVEGLPVLEAIRIWKLSGCCHHVRRESSVPLRYPDNRVATLHDVFHIADLVRTEVRKRKEPVQHAQKEAFGHVYCKNCCAISCKSEQNLGPEGKSPNAPP